MKNKKYEGSSDTAGKMPFMSQKIDDLKSRSNNPEENTNKEKAIELDDRIIEIHDK